MCGVSGVSNLLVGERVWEYVVGHPGALRRKQRCYLLVGVVRFGLCVQSESVDLGEGSIATGD